MKKLSKITAFTISTVVILFAAGCAPEPTTGATTAPTESTAPTIETIWIDAMAIDCGDLSPEDCRAEYEVNVIKNAGQGGKEEFAKDLFTFLNSVAEPGVDRDAKVNEAMGQDGGATYNSTDHFSEEFWAAVETDDRLIFLGVPSDTVDAELKLDVGYIPVTFVTEDGDVIDTFDFSFNMSNGKYEPCLLETCNS